MTSIKLNTYAWRLEGDMHGGHIFAGRQLPYVQIVHADYGLEGPQQIRFEDINVNWAGYRLK